MRLPRRTALALTLAALLLGLAAETSPAQASSLRYFGYFAARITQAGGDHLAEVAGRSNLDWVQISDPDRYRPEVLDGCAPAGCIISTGNEFFRNCSGVHVPECELYPNYAERWSKLAAAVRTRIDKVGAFYLMDEPQYRGATKAELEVAAATIKATYPTIPVMMVEAGPEVTTSYEVPADVDWVGFDWYCQEFGVIEEKLTILTGRIGDGQSLFLVPESAPLAACGGSPGHATDAEIARLQYRYYDLALANPRVIGLLAFGFWTSGYGTAQLPQTVAAHQAIYAAILAANQPPPAPSPPPAPAVEPPAASPTPAPQRPDRVVRIAGTQVTVGRRGPLAIHLDCPRANAGPCAGRLSLRMPHRRRHPGGPSHPGRGLIGSSPFSLDPGRDGVVRVGIPLHLRGRLVRLAQRGHPGRIRVSVVTAAGAASAALRLRMPVHGRAKDGGDRGSSRRGLALSDPLDPPGDEDRSGVRPHHWVTWADDGPVTSLRPDRGGAPPLGRALAWRGCRRDGRGHLGDARAPDPDGAAERVVGAFRADVSSL